MLLYLAQGPEVKRIDNICLKNGTLPTVNVISGETLDPALWFKVMICDSVLIDLDRRHVYWSSDIDPEAEALHKCQLFSIDVDGVRKFFSKKDLLLEDEVGCTFDPFLCELFDLASSIFNQLCLRVFDKDGNVGTYQNVMSLVHSFILPSMTFSQKHQDKLREVLKNIDGHHTSVSKQIEKKNTATSNGKEKLQKMRMEFISDEKFMKPSNISALDKRFVDTLVSGIVTDITKVKHELVQIEVETQTSTCKSLSLQKKKDECCNLMEKLLTANSALINSHRSSRMSNLFRRGSQQENIYSIYTKIASEMEILDTETKELIKINLRISAVREATQFMLGELASYRESVGFSRPKGSLEHEIDLGDLITRPKTFRTICERVQILLGAETRDQFLVELGTFSLRIKNKCKKLCDEAGMFNDFQLISLRTEGSHTGRSQTIIHAVGNNSESEVFRSTLQNECKQVCEDVVAHITTTATQLESLLQDEQRSELANVSIIVYMTYAEHVFRDLMPDIRSIYEIVNKQACGQLADWLASVTLEELGLSIPRVMKSTIPPTAKSKKMRTLERVARSSVTSRRGRQTLRGHGSVKHNKPVQRYDDDVVTRNIRSLYRQLSSEMPDSFVGALELGIRRADEEIGHRDADVLGDIPRSDSSDRSKKPGKVISGQWFPDISPSHCSAPNDSPMAKRKEAAAAGNEASHKNMEVRQTYVCAKDTNVKQSDTDDHSQTFHKHFELFDTYIEAAVVTNSLSTKMKEFTRSMKYIEKRLTELRRDGGMDTDVCLDDLLDVTVILIRLMGKDRVLAFHAHLNLLIDLLPDFTHNSIHEYALVIYQSAFQFLFDQSLLKTSMKKE